MSSRLSHRSGFTKVIIIIEFFLVAYLLYSLTRNVYNNYQVDKLIAAFEQENLLLAEENKQKSEDYMYFTSQEYIDKIAKQNWNLVNPGEEVIVLSPEVLEPDLNFDGDEIYTFAKYTGESNAEMWKNFFFGD